MLGKIKLFIDEKYVDEHNLRPILEQDQALSGIEPEIEDTEKSAALFKEQEALTSIESLSTDETTIFRDMAGAPKLSERLRPTSAQPSTKKATAVFEKMRKLGDVVEKLDDIFEINDVLFEYDQSLLEG